MEPADDRLDEIVVLGRRALEDRARADVHVRRVALEMQERGVEAREPVRIDHVRDSCKAMGLVTDAGRRVAAERSVGA
jgi:hypothetical protein